MNDEKMTGEQTFIVLLAITGAIFVGTFAFNVRGCGTEQLLIRSRACVEAGGIMHGDMECLKK